MIPDQAGPSSSTFFARAASERQMLHPAVCPDDASCEDGLLSQHLQFSDDKPEKKVINWWIQKMDHCFVWVETLICRAFPTPRFGEPISIWRRRLVSACLNLFNSNKTATELSQNVYGYWFNSQTFQIPPTNCKTTLQRLGVKDTWSLAECTVVALYQF